MLELSDDVLNGVSWSAAVAHEIHKGKGWRIPTKRELQIIHASGREIEYNGKFAKYWSITEHDRENAWYVNFCGGEIDYDDKELQYAVRCIRGTFADVLEWCFGLRKPSEMCTIVNLGSDGSDFCTCGGPSKQVDDGFKKYAVCAKCKKEKKQ